MPTGSDLELAHRLADAAAAISLAYFNGTFERWNKADGSIVTAADFAVERELRSLLERERPDDSILGEELGQTGAGPRRWIIDAIDGTADFAAGRPDWGTLIALEVHGLTTVGVCDLTVHGRRYWAARGEGAFSTSPDRPEARRLQVSANAEVNRAASYIPRREWTPDDGAADLCDALRALTAPAAQRNHPALQVAEGDYDVALFLLGGPWDIAAPALIVEEAGGRFSDIHGDRTIDSGNAVFSNGRVHEVFLEALSMYATKGRRGVGTS